MVPLGHIHAAYVRSHFGTAEMTLWDSPRRDEIAFGFVMATGGRPHARIGGLAASAISVHDGQRGCRNGRAYGRRAGSSGCPLPRRRARARP
ncbi:FIG030567 hypothetical protein [Bradyrhizobium sp.]|uniref:amino acid synthesis family protein n=1 Tax=Bradyrhizobium sp. TaxID=376 RepID=UPI0007C19909|nr:amino acid synthesis family protein [Bradyrhizobium sp.]CUT10527.1 FIG030567 hypothetical protein [Bradyrhizobium sp.]